jgi:hypothetical protein
MLKGVEMEIGKKGMFAVAIAMFGRSPCDSGSGTILCVPSIQSHCLTLGLCTFDRLLRRGQPKTMSFITHKRIWNFTIGQSTRRNHGEVVLYQ